MRRFLSFHRCQRIVAANAPFRLAFGRCLSCSSRWSHHRQNSEKLPEPVKECGSDWDQMSVAKEQEVKQCRTDSPISSHLGQGRGGPIRNSRAFSIYTVLARNQLENERSGKLYDIQS
ncbi:hypothetical protein PIB30_049868 [Stylosanthes scabra]|uniref:Uncharacterized protein n=1 Tax=Stylosanthes scabra TaxID=79078 RepID=A0ABU6TJM7_9FABA|nr:hypothetical protein [Stylosanthes scabra]